MKLPLLWLGWTAIFCAPGFARRLRENDATPDVFAQSALNTILGDVQQEIVAGSNATTAGSSTIYSPKVPVTAVPSLVGSTGTGGLENLLKRSVFGQPFYPFNPYDFPGSNRAANLSTGVSSLNGFAVLPARWNRPLLLLKANSASATDQAPVSMGPNAFVIPDWVLVARDGSNPIWWNPTLQTSPGNSTSVVGRYAYTIYDEGGVLDMTTAGYASGTDSRQVGYKDSLALADLTQVGLTPAQVDSVVNWRASHAFAGRQDLISLLTQTMATGAETRAALQNSLRYLGTFSRGSGQPSYAPVSRMGSATNPNPRPLIQTSAATSGGAGGGNNVGDNYTTAAAQDVFSPSLLAVRVVAGGSPQWVRNDGTASVVGEPLVKNRFPLQRLSWITYKGPAASNAGDSNLVQLTSIYGIPSSYLQKGTDVNVRNYFGLLWDATNHLWKYNVHNRGGTTGAIRNIQEIVDQREPDFFELLKASVDPGALGKASIKADGAQPGDPSLSPLNFDFRRDVSLDAAIIQLGANIIDQYDLDGYPTRILFDDGSGNPAREFRGVENLPYIYRIRTGALKVRESNPASERNPNGTLSLTPYLHSGTQSGFTVKPLIDTGAGIIMSVPDIWNPHDQNSSLGSPGPGQSGVIRLVANSATPDTIYANTGTSTTGYSSFSTGGYAKTDASYGSYRGTSFSGAVTPDATANPPIPYFTRGANADGRLSNSSLVMSGSNGGFNYPHVISPTTSNYLTFKFATNNALYREPTLLGQADPTGPSALTMVVDSSNLDIINLQAAGTARAYSSVAPTYGIKTIAGLNPLGVPGGSATTTQGYIGMILGTYPLRWVGPRWSGSNAGTLWNYSDDSLADTGVPVSSITYSLQYQDPAGGSTWVTYDEKYIDSDLSFVRCFDGQLVQPGTRNYTFVDPRTPRFGSPTENNLSGGAYSRAPLTAAQPTTWANTWLDYSGRLLSVVTEKPDASSGFGSNFRGTTGGDWGGYAAPGWHIQSLNTSGGVNAIFWQTGLFAQNNPYFPSDGLRFVGDIAGGVGPRDANFWSDPDGVVRRAMGGYVTSGNSAGQPLATATTFSGGTGTGTAQGQSRPIVLNRPFRSVAELGAVFSGNPWKNVDFSTPESAYSELLDVFCATEPDNSSVLTAGKLNLNTRQPLALKSVLAGAYVDEQNNFTNGPAWSIAPLTATDAESISRLLIARTSVAPPSGSVNAWYGPQPLVNVADLVGRWNGAQAISGTFTPALGSVHNVDGSRSYDGFSADLTTLTSLTGLSTDSLKIPRLRESAVRALTNVGNTRVWNLMIDLIAQTGQYPQTSSRLDQFVVEGSQRYWLHVAIDRLTGEVLDQSLESVPEVPPTDVAIDHLTVAEGQPAGTPVGALSATDSNQAGTLNYALVTGTGGNDNAAFSVSGTTLQTTAAFRFLDKSSYSIRVRVSDQDSLSFEKAFTVTVLPSAYTQWKLANFAGQANDPAVAGDLVDADQDGMVNILEYALGTSPQTANSPGSSLQRDGNVVRFNYTRLTAATDVSAHAYWNSDLTNPNGWTTQGITETLLSDDGTLQYWQATLPVGASQSVFLRLQVTKP